METVDILEYIEFTRMAKAERMKTEALNEIYLLIGFDMDKTLTEETCWTEEDCLNAEPNIEMVQVIKKVSLRDITFIYTGRQLELFNATYRWLMRQEIRVWGVTNFKMPADIYVDDRAINPFLNTKIITKKTSTHSAWQKPEKEVKFYDPVTLDHCNNCSNDCDNCECGNV